LERLPAVFVQVPDVAHTIREGTAADKKVAAAEAGTTVRNERADNPDMAYLPEPNLVPHLKRSPVYQIRIAREGKNEGSDELSPQQRQAYSRA
jgi:hypothetical protein